VIEVKKKKRGAFVPLNFKGVTVVSPSRGGRENEYHSIYGEFRKDGSV